MSTTSMAVEHEDWLALLEIGALAHLSPQVTRSKDPLDPNLGLRKAALHYAIKRTLEQLREETSQWREE